MELTGKATEIMVASKAVARLTTAIEVKAARSRHPGLNFSISAGFELVVGSMSVSVFSGSIISAFLISEPGDGSVSIL